MPSDVIIISTFSNLCSRLYIRAVFTMSSDAPFRASFVSSARFDGTNCAVGSTSHPAKTMNATTKLNAPDYTPWHSSVLRMVTLCGHLIDAPV